MPNTALITGASSGIGREFARLHASKGGDLIITARRKDELDALKSELETAHSVRVHTFTQDLGAQGGADVLWKTITDAGLSVDILINNAGFGGHGSFIDRELADDMAMIDLNIKALATLTHHAAIAMAVRGAGRILNVSSTAAHMPGPLQATYFATKAFVSSFSQAIANELSDKGVTVTALEPGYVETGFADRADLGGTNLVKSGATPAEVARIGYDAMLAGKLTVINDGKLALMLGWIMPLMPKAMKLNFVRKMQEKQG